MEKRTIEISLEDAKKWYKSGNKTLRTLVQSVFTESELNTNYKNITCVRDAAEALGLDWSDISGKAYDLAKISKASSAMFKLNIVRQALHLCCKLKFDKGNVYYPFNPLVTQPERYSSTVVGKVKYKDTIYFVLFEYTNLGANYGISGFTARDKMASANAQSSFLGCANKEIAEHFGKYFGALITEAKFGDLKDFSVISYNEIKKQ
nr:MAG TPA: hypothetical protein [Bacteriophage sp.]